jgi:HlyD family secretion protein
LELDKAYVEMNGTIRDDEDKIKKLEDQLQVSGVNAEDREIAAPMNGVVNVITEVSAGDLLQAGTEVATIVPQADSQYSMQISMLNKDIGKIKVGDKIKYHFAALPYKEYGELTGRISTIGADAIVDPQSGASYYAVEATIDNKPLYNNKGQQVSIKSGMVAEVNVVTGSKRILSELLEKINLKD